MEFDKRSNLRVKSPGVIYYSNSFHEEKSQKQDEKQEGYIVDICSSGICIRTNHGFEFGSKVQFDIEEYYKGTFTGTVRWCVMSTENKYYVGLEVPFIKDSIIH